MKVKIGSFNLGIGEVDSDRISNTDNNKIIDLKETFEVLDLVRNGMNTDSEIFLVEVNTKNFIRILTVKDHIKKDAINVALVKN